jgi:photosystem II stability/assembly factor-like uncharacterized protein
MKPTRTLLIAIVLALASATASAQQISMKQIAPGVGWVESAGQLYWTNDNGAHWKGITPRLDPDERLNNIFFLDPSKAWITINHDEPPSEVPKFDLVSTADGGATWSRMTFSLPPKHYGISVPTQFVLRGGGGAVAFVDSLHGWMNVWLGVDRSTWWSFLLQTSDGGRTWNRAADAPDLPRAQILLVTPNEGWLFGVDDDHERRLYVTRDRARSWQEVAPEPAGLTYHEIFGLPTFEDGIHGFLQINGLRGHNPKSLTLTLMATSDGGRTWKTDRTVTNLDETSRRQYRSPTTVGSDWIFAAFDGHPVLTRVGPGITVDASTDTTASRSHYKDVRQISFATPADGWAVVGDGNLLSTTDGGATWTNITPAHTIHPQHETPR